MIVSLLQECLDFQTFWKRWQEKDQTSSSGRVGWSLLQCWSLYVGVGVKILSNLVCENSCNAKVQVYTRIHPTCFVLINRVAGTSLCPTSSSSFSGSTPRPSVRDWVFWVCLGVMFELLTPSPLISDRPHTPVLREPWPKMCLCKCKGASSTLERVQSCCTVSHPGWDHYHLVCSIDRWSLLSSTQNR